MNWTQCVHVCRPDAAQGLTGFEHFLICKEMLLYHFVTDGKTEAQRGDRHTGSVVNGRPGWDRSPPQDSGTEGRQRGARPVPELILPQPGGPDRGCRSRRGGVRLRVCYICNLSLLHKERAYAAFITNLSGSVSY